jgi:hypothetical protein
MLVSLLVVNSSLFWVTKSILFDIRFSRVLSHTNRYCSFSDLNRVSYPMFLITLQLRPPSRHLHMQQAQSTNYSWRNWTSEGSNSYRAKTGFIEGKGTKSIHVPSITTYMHKEGVEIQLHVFVIWELDQIEWSPSWFGCLYSGKKCFMKHTITYHCWAFNPLKILDRLTAAIYLYSKQVT